MWSDFTAWVDSTSIDDDFFGIAFRIQQNEQTYYKVSCSIEHNRCCISLMVDTYERKILTSTQINWNTLSLEPSLIK